MNKAVRRLVNQAVGEQDCFFGGGAEVGKERVWRDPGQTRVSGEFTGQTHIWLLTPHRRSKGRGFVLSGQSGLATRRRSPFGMLFLSEGVGMGSEYKNLDVIF